MKLMVCKIMQKVVLKTGVHSNVPSSSLRRIDSLLSEAIRSFNNFNKIDIDSEKNIHNASMLVKKHLEGPMDDFSQQIDLRLAINLLEKVGQIYHIDLTPV